MVTLTFGDDLANFGNGSFRLRIGDAYQPVDTRQRALYDSADNDVGSTFADADTTSNLGYLRYLPGSVRGSHGSSRDHRADRLSSSGRAEQTRRANEACPPAPPTSSARTTR